MKPLSSILSFATAAFLLFTVSCVVPASAPVGANPATSYVPLAGATEGWNASLVLDNGSTGIWRMEPVPLLPQYATPELIGLDDKGVCWVMVSYSGKWTPLRVLNDGAWLGAVTFGDIDPQAEGNELYVGGENGLLYQVRSYKDGGLDARRIARFPSSEIHTLNSGDLDPNNPGKEILVFTRPGALYRVHRAESGEFQTELLSEISGRIRDSMLMPDGRTMLTAGRNGDVSLLTLEADGLHWQVIHHADQGRGRLAIGAMTAVGLPILYSSGDFGRIFRHEPTASGDWSTTTIYAGPVGPRGLVSGQFHTDPSVETVAVFGYSGRVELLENHDGAWSTSTLFTDRDRGHWLSVVEIDGRNNTSEIMLSGYGGRMVMLSKDPGSGLDVLAVPVELDRHAKP
jgi:hypothetical protein